MAQKTTKQISRKDAQRRSKTMVAFWLVGCIGYIYFKNKFCVSNTSKFIRIGSKNAKYLAYFLLFKCATCIEDDFL